MYKISKQDLENIKDFVEQYQSEEGDDGYWDSNYEAIEILDIIDKILVNKND